ncbi:hypothetical protein Pelo_16302 [Pelomyxa schiedti]|nr:hypothetical protein Pelo_16302 [Pelomyxa schiedti]
MRVGGWLVFSGPTITSEGGDARPLLSDSVLSDAGQVRAAIIADPSCVYQTDSWGKMPIHIACSRGYIGAIRVLLEEGNCDVDVRAQDGSTPLHCAASFGQLYVVFLLIHEYGARVGARRLPNGDTALYLSCFRDRVDVAKLLIDSGALLMARNSLGQTAIDAASRSGYSDLACFLRYHASGTRRIEPPVVRHLAEITAKTEAEIQNKSNLLRRWQQQDCLSASWMKPIDLDGLRTSSLAIKIIVTSWLGRKLLSGRDCLACSQVCHTWRRELCDDNVWLHYIKYEISDCASNILNYHDSTIPSYNETLWKNVCTQVTSQDKQYVTKWAASPAEVFRGNSKTKYLWIARKKGRVRMPLYSPPVYNPFIHNKWWNPLDLTLCLWCYIFHHNWMAFFISQSMLVKQQCYDKKILCTVRNSFGAIGILWTLVLLYKYLYFPNGSLFLANYIISLIFSNCCAHILLAFSLTSPGDRIYWFPVTMFIIAIFPFPYEWIYVFRTVCQMGTILLIGTLSALNLIAFFLLWWKKYSMLESALLAPLLCTTALFLWYGRFLVVLRLVSVGQLHLFKAYHTYNITSHSHAIAMIHWLCVLVVSSFMVVKF